MTQGRKIVATSVEYSNPWFDVVAKDVAVTGNKDTSRYYMIRPADYVVVMAETDAEELLLVRQYRPAVEEFTLEFPSGHVEKGEVPEVTAARELFEETGYEADHLQHLGTLAPDTGRLVNRLWCYFARARRTKKPYRPEEGVTLVASPRGDIRNLVLKGQLRHAHDLAVLALANAANTWTYPNAK